MGIVTSDADLLEASRRGEHSAFGALVERYQGVVCAVSYSRTRDQALSEDVAQETFLAAWQQLDQLREAGRLRSWLCGIAKNLASKARKRRVREVPSDGVADHEPARGDPFDALDAAQSEALVGDALGRVPEKYRDVLVLYYREQKPIAEVAEMLGITEAAALQRLARGRQYLADGVQSLVERSLRALPKKSLVASVVAALPLIAVPRVEANPTSGGNMFAKIGIAAALLAAAGGAAVVVAKRDASPSATRSTTSSSMATPAPAEAPAAKPTARAAAVMPALPSKLAPGSVPTLEAAPVVDNDKLAAARIAEGPSRGPANAPVVVSVFTDLQCSYCADAIGTLDQLMDEYPNTLRIVVKQMPVHQTAVLAAEAALAADAQGKFWELHDLMMQNQDDLSRDVLLALGQQAGLDVARLTADLDTHAYKAALRAEMDAAKSIEIRATPTFVINGRKVVGLLPIEELRATIDAALASD
ncbi:MAG: sigma-70 family RNA polymerase sigma factor [Kofleriaceae bacterium]